MNFTHYDLGMLEGGRIIEITLSGNSANVKLMDSNNFQSYRNGRKHTYFGCHVTRSPYKISIPNSGHWHIAIDLGGYAGNVNSSIRVL
jgi:hypothetical protein